MAGKKERIGVVVVDVQGDFTQFKKGSLAVAGTDEAFIKALHEGTWRLKRAGYPIYATQDWHPPDHVSFYTNHPGKKPFDPIRIDGRTQVLWPPHCVRVTQRHIHLQTVPNAHPRSCLFVQSR